MSVWFLGRYGTACHKICDIHLTNIVPLFPSQLPLLLLATTNTNLYIHTKGEKVLRKD